MALVIKSLAVDPPNYDELSDDEDDFVKDPAQYRDQLPQPFRFIDEVLNLFLDDVWDVITDKERAKVAELSKVRPPKYECAVQLQEYSNCKTIVPSEDGRYLFIAYPGGLAIMDPSSKQVLHSIDDDRLDITSLSCTIIGVETYLLTGVDELGICKIFGCALEKLFVMKVFNEESNSTRFQVVKCQPSVDGDYLGIVLEDPSSFDSVLDIYHLPRDTWNKEIEDIKPILVKSDVSAIQPNQSEYWEAPPDQMEAGPGPDAEEETEEQISAKKSTESLKSRSSGTRGKSDETRSVMHCPSRTTSRASKFRSRHRSGSQRREISGNSKRSEGLPSKRHSKSNSRRRKTGSKKGVSVFKFSLAVLVMKQKPPESFSANISPSPAATLKDVADPNQIMGSGHGHLLTKAYTDIRQESFNSLHQDRFMYRKNDSDLVQAHRDCSFHFFTAGLTIPYGIDQPGAREKTTSVGIWWSGSNQFIYYCLTKPVKQKKPVTDNADAALTRGSHDTVTSKLGQVDLSVVSPKSAEVELKPETIWPQAAAITASATSPDSSLVALGLINGIVTIWDKHLCCVRKSIVVSKSAVMKVDFMDPSICAQSNNRQQCYPTTTSCYVVIRCADSSILLLNCGQLDFSPPITLSSQTEDDDLCITEVQLFSARCPEIILRVHKNGSVYLHDVVVNKTLCEVALPHTHKLTTPWQPILSVAAYGQMLYIKGSQMSSEGQADNTKEALFVFQLRSFPSLDSYWMRQRSTINFLTLSPMETRVNALLTHRVKSSAARQQRLQQRWPLMKQELNRISQIKSH